MKIQKLIHCAIAVLLIFSIPATSFAKAGIPTTASQDWGNDRNDDQQHLSTQTVLPEVSVDPSIDLTNLDPLGPFILEFNQPMETSNLAETLLTYPYTPNELGWDDTATILTFTPTEGFEPGKSYTFFLDPDLKTKDGQRFAEIQYWQGQVRAGPAVSFRNPNVENPTKRSPTIQLGFNRPMDQESVTEALSVQPYIPLSLSWERNTLTINLEQPLTPGQRYSFLLSTRATDTQGISMDDDYLFDYWLNDFTISVINPTLNFNRVRLQLNYDIDTKATDTPFTISPEVEGEWKWTDSKHAEFTPASEIEYGVVYNIHITGEFIDVFGKPLPEPDSPIEFYAPPPIASASPNENSHDDENSISIVFTMPMDKDSTQEAFTLEPAAEGIFEWDGNKLIYRLSKTLLPWQEYSVKLDTSALDESGKPILLTPYSWTFWSYFDYNTYATSTSFASYGPNVQEINANGRRIVHFRASPEETTLNFALYPLELGELAVKFASEYGYYSYNQSPQIDTDGFDAIYKWQATYPKGGFQEVLIPEEVSAGAYILEMSYGSSVRGQLFISLTSYMTVAKLAGDDLFVWVSDFEGNGIADLEVRLYSNRGEKIRVGTTNENGIYRTTVPDGYSPMIVGTLSKDGDVSFVGLSGYAWQSETGDTITADESDYYYWYYGSTPKKYIVYTYTDRPIYRPGQTVYFKSIIREDNDVRYTLPQNGMPVIVRLRDGRDNLLQEFELTVNDFGSVNGEFSLVEGAMLGSYKIEIEVKSEVHQQVFKVQDYRKSDIQLSVSTDATKYVKGENVVVDIDANYLFGEPLSGARLTINFYTLNRIYWGSDEYNWNPNGTGIQVTTDAQGHASYTFVAREAEKYSRVTYWRSNLEESRWAIEVTVNDGSNQTVSSSAIFKVYNTSEIISMDINGGYLHSPGQPITINVRSETINGEPVPERNLQIASTWHSRVNDNFSKQDSFQLTTNSDGTAQISITVESVGYYELRLYGTDSFGKVISYSRWFYIYKQGDNWVSKYEHKITITPNKQSYQPYDTATLFIESSISGPALLTFERNSVIHYKKVELEAPVTVIDVEIIPEYAPNIFISVSAWEGQDTHLVAPKKDYYWTPSIPESVLRRATAEILVEPLGKTLNVLIAPDKEYYAPRQDASFTIRVSDTQDKPVSAEISLALVDEAIFNLSEDLSGSIFDAFYSRRHYSVRTYDSMSPIRYLVYDEGAGGGGGDGGMYPGGPRQDFPDTAAWYPVLRTDKNGEAQITLTLPDNLTSWRVIVKAIAANTRVGQSYINIQTKQEIVIRPIFPATLTAGDQVELAALIYNYSQREKPLTVDINSGGILSVPELTEQKLVLQPNEALMVTWPIAAEEAGQAEVIITANTDTGPGDSILLPINVRPLSIPDIYTQSGDFTGELVTTLVRPAGALAQSMVEIRLSRSMAGTLFEGLAYLTGYPYGCVEQTMSRALPNAVVGRALNRFGVIDPLLEGKLPGLINMGLQRLYGMQHSDGGWGWWHDDATNDYQTAWVIFGLALTADAGYAVEPGVIERGSKWLQNHLEEMDIRTRAYALYSLSLAGYSDPIATQNLAVEAYQLDTFSQAALALAIIKQGNTDEALRLLGMLAESHIHKESSSGGLAYWPQSNDDGEYYNKIMSSSIRSTALALEAYVQIDPQNSLIPEITNYLMQERKSEGWGSTNETTFAILALTDHLLTLQTDNPDINYAIQLNGEEIDAGSFPSNYPTFTFEMPVENMQTGANLLSINQDSDREMFYTIISKMLISQSEIPASGIVQIKRSFTAVNNANEKFHIGDIVRVNLEIIIAKGASFIIINDLLPGGLEALNENLNSTSHDAMLDYCWDCYGPRYGFHWQDYGYNQKEVHPDRVTFFITEFKPGKITITYLARSTHAGTFIALPTEVSAMYDAKVWGRSASSPLTIDK